MLARDGAGVGAEGGAPIVYKKILLVDLAGATNLAGTAYETSTRSVLQDGATPALRSDIVPALTGERVDMLDPVQLAGVGLTVERLSEKWEAMDLVSVLEPEHPRIITFSSQTTTTSLPSTAGCLAIPAIPRSITTIKFWFIA